MVEETKYQSPHSHLLFKNSKYLQSLFSQFDKYIYIILCTHGLHSCSVEAKVIELIIRIHNPISKKIVFSIHIRVYQFLQRIQLYKSIWPCCVTVEFPLSFGFSLTQVLMPFLPFFFLNVTLFTSLQVMFHQYLTTYPPFNCTKKFYVDPSIEVLQRPPCKKIVERRHGQPIKFLFLLKMGLLQYIGQPDGPALKTNWLPIITYC